MKIVVKKGHSVDWVSAISVREKALEKIGLHKKMNRKFKLQGIIRKSRRTLFE